MSVNYNGVEYFYLKNAQGDITGLVDSTGTQVVTYTYDAWGKLLSTTGTKAYGLGADNPFRYRGYMYDEETGLYYLNSRYYNPATGRFISADNALSMGDDLTGKNLFAYCGNNPINRIDSNGNAWWHWALGAAVVAACAVATVVTAGGFLAGVSAVAAVGSGVAAATTASTVAAGAFIGSATAFTVQAVGAAMTSNSIKEFNEKGNGGTVLSTVGGAAFGGTVGYTLATAQTKSSTPAATSPQRGMQNPSVRAAAQKGQAMHKQMDYGPGVLKEQTIAPGCRVDGIDKTNHIIYELKPNNPRAINRGLRQLERYTQAAHEKFGGEWTGVLKLYE